MGLGGAVSGKRDLAPSQFKYRRAILGFCKGRLWRGGRSPSISKKVTAPKVTQNFGQKWALFGGPVFSLACGKSGGKRAFGAALGGLLARPGATFLGPQPFKF